VGAKVPPHAWGYGRVMNVSLRPLSGSNVRAVCGLRLADGQGHLVAPAACTVAEGHYEPGALLRAIYLDDEPVGVLLVEVESGTPYLVRFMVDADHQRRGVGRRAVELLVGELRADGWSVLETSFVPVDEGAEGFWRRCGFEHTGRTRHAEPLLVRAL
jgi:diamine N-acetyltransferase